MTKQLLYTLLKHLIIWSILIFLLTNSYLVWGWTIAKAYNTMWVQLYGALTNALTFYVTSFYLIPNLLNQQRKNEFIFQSILLLLVVSFIELYFDTYIGAYYQNSYYQGALQLETWNFLLEGLLHIIPINIVYYFIAFAYRGPMDRKELYERKLILQREKLESELQLLKAQIHPHTLFNGMSSIYHLIDTKPHKAKSLVLNLSNALRYHLYESSDDFVLLTRELDYLRQYIALNQIRIEDNVTISIYFDEFEDEVLIAPLLFTPFVENAFKYVSQFPTKEENTIRIEIQIEAFFLSFFCENTVERMNTEKYKIGGIGLENTHSRLDLIYGNQYELKVKNTPKSFCVKLKIPLKEML